MSGDSAASHQKFKAKYGLPMSLLLDEDHAIAEKYGVWVEKNTFGVKRLGIARTTFVIDPKGNVARVWPKADPSGHGEDVASVLESLQKA